MLLSRLHQDTCGVTHSQKHNQIQTHTHSFVVIYWKQIFLFMNCLIRPKIYGLWNVLKVKKRLHIYIYIGKYIYFEHKRKSPFHSHHNDIMYMLYVVRACFLSKNFINITIYVILSINKQPHMYIDGYVYICIYKKRIGCIKYGYMTSSSYFKSNIM